MYSCVSIHPTEILRNLRRASGHSTPVRRGGSDDERTERHCEGNAPIGSDRRIKLRAQIRRIRRDRRCRECQGEIAHTLHGRFHDHRRTRRCRRQRGRFRRRRCIQSTGTDISRPAAACHRGLDAATLSRERHRQHLNAQKAHAEK